MEKAIMKDPFFLSQVSEEAAKEDLYLAQDLQDTLRAHQDSCVGMAANMIGVRKRVIIIQLGLMPLKNELMRQKKAVFLWQEVEKQVVLKRFKSSTTTSIGSLSS